MLCGLLILAIVSFNVRCDQCCSAYECSLFGTSQRCTSSYGCKWENDKCNAQVCGDYTTQSTCVRGHSTGTYTKGFYCKWGSDDKCVAGNNACADYSYEKWACLGTGKCKYDGTTCSDASSCADFPDDCQSVSFNGSQCYKDGDVCKKFTCDLLTKTTCTAYGPNFCYIKGDDCATVTTCGVLDSGTCSGRSDVNGNKCSLKGTTCKAFACSDLETQTDCLGEFDKCSWNSTAKACGNKAFDVCEYLPESTCVMGCYYQKSCPAAPGSSSHIIYVPALLVALLFVLFL